MGEEGTETPVMDREAEGGGAELEIVTRAEDEEASSAVAIPMAGSRRTDITPPL